MNSKGNALGALITALFYVFVICSIVWVYFDAQKLMAGLTSNQRYAVSNLCRNSSHWAVACALLWIVFFPLYLLTREKYKKMQRAAINLPEKTGGFPVLPITPPDADHKNQADQPPPQ